MVTAGFFRGPPFDPDTAIPDLADQVYIVTGASTGIGFAIVAHLLQHNAAKIITISSREENGLKAVSEWKKWGDTSRVTFQKCNFANLNDTDRVARKLKDEEKRIDGLILNAGIGVNAYGLSEDGIDRHFQINALAQLHLGLMLLPILQATSVTTKIPSRLIMASSEMHRFAPGSTQFASLDELNTDIGPIRLYSRSKLAQILMVRELVRRMDEGQIGSSTGKDAATKQRSVLVNATHPGGVLTPQQEQMVPAYGWAGWLMMIMVRPLMVDPMTLGCQSALFASTPNPELLDNNGIHGQYIIPNKKVSQPSAQGTDDEMAKRLWKLSMDLIEEKLATRDYRFEVVP